MDTEMAQEAIEASSSGAEVIIRDSTVSLGGGGGNAAGAGGGGGGVIGRGGRGGAGGAHRIDRGEYSLPLTDDEATARLTDHPLHRADVGSGGLSGAGGGGAGAIGDGAVAGDGGSGGEHVSARIDIAELRNQGLDHIEFTVGEGGSGSRLPGQHGSGGEDTLLKFVARDGTLLKTIRARGGSGGDFGPSYLPDGVAELSADDINLRGFCITTFMPSNAVDVRDGLVFVLGGDWKGISVPTMPFDAVWPVVCTARWRSLQGAVARGIFLSLIILLGMKRHVRR